MKLNLFTMPTIPSTVGERIAERPIGRSTPRYQLMLDELRDLAVFADEVGVDAFSTTEHHFHTEGGEVMPNPLMLSTDLAARTQNMQLVPFSIVIPTWNPLRVAEDVALLDQFSRGRAGVAFARGYQKRWFQVITQGGHVSNETREGDAENREIFEENIELVLKAWREKVFDFNGKHFQVPFPYDEGVRGWPALDWTRTFGADGEIDDEGAIRKIGTVPGPYREAGPEVYLPLTLSPATIDYCAKMAFTGFVFTTDPKAFRELAEKYRQTAEGYGHKLTLGQKLGATRHISIANTYDEAFELASRSTAHLYQDYFGQFGFNENFRTDADDPNKPVTFKDEYACTQRLIDFGSLYCGTVDDVKRQVEAVHGIHGAGGELEWLQWAFYPQGLLPLDEQKRQLEAFMTKVMPEFR